MRDASGRIIAASKVARDITARKRAEEEHRQLTAQLQQADQRKDEFLATLAHELRNPLAPISNSLHILRLSDDLSPAAERIRQVMEQQVNLMVRLVDDLLEVSRITRDKIELRKEPVEVAAIVRNAVEISRPLMEAVGHQFALSLPPEPILLEADPVRLAQVVANLLNNAAKYTEPGGQIWLAARREGHEAIVSVRDNGLGIPADMLPRVFEMFTQIDRTLNRSQGGLGIGLTLARSLVQLHGGRIEARSGGLGQGSEFVVRLPVAVQAPVAGVPVAPMRSHPTLPMRRIVVLDDTRAAAFTLGKLLEALGQNVTTVLDGKSALECLHTWRPHMAISDIGMPNMDGFEFARLVRTNPELKDVLLVALTGYGQDNDRERALAAGFDHYLVKPVSLDALEQLLKLAAVPTSSPAAMTS